MTAGCRLGGSPYGYTAVSRSPHSLFFSYKLQPWWTWTSMPAVVSLTRDTKVANGQKVILPGSFLNDHPRTMESGYLHIEWNNIPRLYNRKYFLRTLVIEKEEWDHLSDPAQLECYWEPTQNSNDFHRTLALALCWTPFHDCKDNGHKKEYVMLVAVI